MTTRSEAESVSRILYVYGTKGGVGKSTMAVNLAYALAATGARVGLLDLDLSGPNVSRLVGGLGGSNPTMVGRRIRPGRFRGVDVSSIGFFVEPVDSVLLTGQYLLGALQQLYFHDAWDDYDHVVVDLPPGFEELHRQVFLRRPGDVVLVSTPHPLSTLDLARGRRLLAELGVRPVGMIENMSHLRCEHCGEVSHLFAGGSRDGHPTRSCLAAAPTSSPHGTESCATLASPHPLPL